MPYILFKRMWKLHKLWDCRLKLLDRGPVFISRDTLQIISTIM